MASPKPPSQHLRSDAALRALSRLPADAPLDQVFREVCESSANTLVVERVGVWLFIDNRTVLRCANLFERSSGEHSSGTLLRVADFPTYFASLTIFKAVPAEVAITDAWTAELAASYLRPLGITSMLDVGLFANEKLLGVICHEHVGPARVWTEDARQFAVAVADFLSERIQAAEMRELRATFMTHGDRLAAMEKNAALEQLAAGVVRHFRNLLDVFQGHGERISVNPDVPLPARRQAAEIMEAAERGAALAGELMQFSSRPESGPPQVLDLGKEISDFFPTLLATMGSRYQLCHMPVRGLGHVLIDRNRFTQLLSHLVKNACEAMPGGGPIEINLTNAKRIGDANRSSLYALLEVTDHSGGLDESALLHVMEPYSASRATGSGLGLAIVRQIVEESGGFISIESAPNRGTTFKVFFPRIGAGDKPHGQADVAVAVR